MAGDPAAARAARREAGRQSAKTGGRAALLERLGIVPPVQDVVRASLRTAIRAAVDGPAPGSKRSRRDLAVLDAGCGRASPLRPFRRRIGRFVGADIHPPDAPLTFLDEFALVDLCGSGDAFPPGSFDLILSNFTVEHLEDPPAAFVNFRRWLRPRGTLVLSTVNRRHPFVAAYLGLPAPLRQRLQPVVKSTPADAHPLVGACNDPAALIASLRTAGFVEIDLTLVGHLARAWGRTTPTFALGLLGDLFARPLPSRRSTIVAVARVPA